MEAWIIVEYTVVDIVKTLWEQPTSANGTKLEHNIFRIRGDLWSIQHHDRGDINRDMLQINQKVMEQNPWAGPSRTDTAVANTDSTKSIAMMPEQSISTISCAGSQRTAKWKVFLEIMMDKNTMMNDMPTEMVIKLIEKVVYTNKEKKFITESLHFVQDDGKGPKSDNGNNMGANDSKRRISRNAIFSKR